ncbi:hypothetical protein Vadar_003676 [Vaccinium darrowii]|uniref:Uncharacterized protein n=1 Tax=Vaccinium darrowii TaxID=229202 RepID=A0ACB7YC38_9ERIC|nr:hypothetical protein Vadar_003676 [Vaccinium darrowii]
MDSAINHCLGLFAILNLASSGFTLFLLRSSLFARSGDFWGFMVGVGCTMDLIDQELDRMCSPNPGPGDLFVLTMQDRYRSKHVWDADIPCEAIMVYVRKTNLEGLLRAPFVALDRALIIALVERWRPETHSFHLGPGKKTVTLQVVEVILGLPTKGEAVIESSDLKDIQQFCMRLLGKAPSKSNNEFMGQKVTMKWLTQFDGQINEEDSKEVVKQKAQGFLLRMLGGTIFADHTGTLINLCWLPLLEDFEKAGRYSWGSSTLGALYNGLCHVATKVKEATGAMILLQIWTWEW